MTLAPRKRVAYMRWYRAQRYARGLCVHCPNPRHPTSSRCTACLEKAKDYDARKRGKTTTRADQVPAYRTGATT